MAVSRRRTERFYLTLLLGAIIGIILVIALFWAGHDLYSRWQERRLVRRAVYAIEHGDDTTASLAARTVLGLRPASAPAARIMAELAEKAGNRAALDWRRKVTLLEPRSVEDALAWARCALQFNDIATAERALSLIDEPDRQRAGYHAVAALLAQARREEDKADIEWAEAVRRAPEEKAYQLQLGMLRLRSSNEDRHAAGKAILTALRSDPKQRAVATRALIVDGAARHENSQLLERARDLQSYPEATLSDSLLYLDLLHQLQDPQFLSYLTDLETSAGAEPARLAALIEWMNRHNLNLLALDFLKGMPPDDLEKWPVPLAVADLYVHLKDWRKVESLTKDANWRQGDFLRHAYLARALRGQEKPAGVEREWAIAQKQASGQAESLVTLARLAADWNWQKETLELLWMLTKYPEKERDALQELYQRSIDTEDTVGLYRVLVRLIEIEPNDSRLQNNLAQVSLLLNADVERAQKMAVELYRKDGANPAYASTYAFALLTKGDRAGALRVMSQLNESQLREPSVAVYYGVVLATSGNSAKAREYLKIAATGKLLPEERQLIARTESSLK
jgi:predicted Zn-dependent protease